MNASSLLPWLFAGALLTGCGRIDFDSRAGDAADDDGGMNAAWPTLAGEWTWIGGSRFKDAVPVYGDLDIADPDANPGSRDNGAMWVVGNELWLFGGIGFGPTMMFGAHSDLWSYDIDTNQWTWRGGTQALGDPGDYGTLDVLAATNLPPPRNDSGFWQSPGSLWFFGGFDRVSTQFYGDVWRYDLGARQWVWFAGSNVLAATSNHGELGVASASNTPGGRGAPATWGDTTGFWSYGGGSYDAGPVGQYGDLWYFDVETRNWTWMSGANTVDAPTIRGTRGVPSTTNQPTAGSACAVGDASNGELWMVDGSADIWRFTIATREWTWIAGPGNDNEPPIHGTIDVTTPTARPGVRGARACWRDLRGNIWVFGGRGLDASGTMGILGDTWVYELATDSWTWVAGSSMREQAPTFGMQGVSDPANTPGARLTGAHWTAPDGSLWMYGGDYARDINGVEGEMNDLWRLAPP